MRKPYLCEHIGEEINSKVMGDRGAKEIVDSLLDVGFSESMIIWNWIFPSCAIRVNWTKRM